MTKLCAICGNSIKHGEKVLVGIVTQFVDLPSSTTWAIEKPEKYAFINHAKCEDLDE